MTETATPSGLTPANENPWYLLMTLYGEQEGEGIDWALHDKNRAVWNAWACQDLSEEERAKLEADGVALPAVGAWEEMKEEVARLHRAAFETRGGAAAAYRGLPDVAARVDFSYTLFPKTLAFEKLIFSADATFRCATFNAYAFFEYAAFCADADFHFTAFRERASFNWIIFSAIANFNSATFSADAIFYSATFSAGNDFLSATFSARAVFQSATFRFEASFWHVTFSGDADFQLGTFSAVANFEGARFSAGAYFNSASFSADAQFMSATFIADASFRSATFSAIADFRSATFSSDAYFYAATFQAPARFVETRFGNPEAPKPALLDLTDAQFEKPASFREAVFLNRYPDFSGTIMPAQTLFPWEPENWPAACDQDPKEGRDSCAVLRHHLGKQGLPEAESFFYRREMGFARRIGSFPARLPYLIYGRVSEYGYSIARPVWFLAAVGMLGALFYWLKAGFDVGTALGYSFANMFKFFGLQRTFMQEQTQALGEIPWGEPVAAAQTVLAFILLFFLGLGLRTRFRLR